MNRPWRGHELDSVRAIRAGMGKPGSQKEEEEPSQLLQTDKQLLPDTRDVPSEDKATRPNPKGKHQTV